MGNRCPRCLQPVPAKSARCPGCRQPVHSSSRTLRLVITFAGLVVLVFAAALTYQMLRSEDAGKAETPAPPKTAEEQLFRDSPPAGSKEPSKPEKKPPLNEQ